jgi:hypothetical protein
MFWVTKLIVEANAEQSPRRLEENWVEQAMMTPRVRGIRER